MRSDSTFSEGAPGVIRWRHPSSPDGSGEQGLELQERIARYASITFAISGVMLLVSFTFHVIAGRDLLDRAVRQLEHITAVVLALAVAVLCSRRRRISPPLLGVLDVALTLALCTAWGLMGWGTPARDPAEFTVILATTYTLIVRAVIVPSSFWKTFIVSALAVLPAAVFIVVRGAPFSANASVEERQMFVVFSLLWCVVAVVMASVLSRTLFGLRERIREIRRLGQYTLTEKIGEGGMGVVYRAAHSLLRRPAAIKLLLPERANPRDLKRFEREVQLTSRLRHPNTVTILDYGHTADGVFYYVMEYIEGLDLERLVALSGPLDAPRTIHILAQAASALVEAHSLGMIHRDVKPANIMLTTRADEPDVVKVVDFGLVKSLQPESDGSAVTMADALVGTPTALAPEAITAPEQIDARVDIYALGVVGYYMLTGQRVFEGNTVIEICSKHLSEAPVPPSQRLGRPIAADLERVILACLEKAPSERMPSAQALRTALLSCSDAPRYDADKARAFWREHAERVRQTKLQREANAATIAVDLKDSDRQGAPESAPW